MMVIGENCLKNLKYKIYIKDWKFKNKNNHIMAENTSIPMNTSKKLKNPIRKNLRKLIIFIYMIDT